MSTATNIDPATSFLLRDSLLSSECVIFNLPNVLGLSCTTLT